MNIKAIPRHQIETSAGDYIRMLAAAARPGGRGEAVRRFEAEFAAVAGCRHAISVSSARLGLELILRGLELGPGEVIVPAFNYFIVVERFIDHGLRPRFADVRRCDLNVDVDDVEALMTPQTRAILATHMFGSPCDLDRLAELARRRGVVMIEDCAHALGSTHRGRWVGTFGRAAIFSFSVMKLITTFGGGMVATDDDELAERVRGEREMLAAGPLPGGGGRKKHSLSVVARLGDGLRRFGKGVLTDVGMRTLPFSLGAWPALRVLRRLRPGFQRAIMTQAPGPVRGWRPSGEAGLFAFQAALGRAQLGRVDRLVEKRRRVSAWLDHELEGARGVALLRSAAAAGFNGMYYGVLADDAEGLSEHLFRQGIDTETSEYRNCAGLDLYRAFARRCPAAEEVARRILRLPNHPSMAREDAARIGRAVRGFYASAAAPAAAPARGRRRRMAGLAPGSRGAVEPIGTGA